MGKIRFDLTKIQFSHQDINRKIVLPKEMNKSLSEEIGIFMGDGSLNIYDYKNRGKYWLQFTGNFTEELEYYKNYVMPLIHSLFNYSGNIIKSNKDNSFILRIYSKSIITFKINVLKLPFGNKSSKVFIPDLIKNSNKLLSPFLRGLADTDFSLTFKKKHKDIHYYPVLKTDLKSKVLVEQVHKALKKFKIKSSITLDNKTFDTRTGKFYIKSGLQISGVSNLQKWMELIGFNNPVHLTKYQIWKKFGFCPPYTKISERISILNNEMGISKFMPQ